MRRLKPKEIVQLEEQGCMCEEWGGVRVTDPFRAGHYRNVIFSGDVRLGVTNNTFKVDADTYQSGIYNARIHNSSIGDNVYINCVHDRISNYDIGEGCFISNVASIRCTEDSTFGNGIEIEPLDETGSIKVPLYESMSTQIAALCVARAGDMAFIDKIRGYVAATYLPSAVGSIGENVFIANCGAIRNVKIHDHAEIKGATRIENGTILSSIDKHTKIGSNVVAKDFIIGLASEIYNGAIIEKCFIGQGCRIGNGFSAHQSLFSSNCHCENGEAAAIIAGPYTVSMHKSSLLIGGMFSFFNAGSGSNQSNHNYKLGPMHYGLCDRGCKSASDSYMLWPARVGAFSIVTGCHISHPDTRSLPFSYLVADGGETCVVPAASLHNVGTFRDFRKWPRRDKRDHKAPLDVIDFSLFNPFTCGNMIKGLSIIDEAMAGDPDRDGFCRCGKFKMRRTSLDKARYLYRTALNFYFATQTAKEIRSSSLRNNFDFADFEQSVRTTEDSKYTEEAIGEWTDLCGCILPERLLDNIVNGCDDPAEINHKINMATKSSDELEWIWAQHQMSEAMGKPLSQFTPQEICRILEGGIKALDEYSRIFAEDAMRDIELSEMLHGKGCVSNEIRRNIMKELDDYFAGCTHMLQRAISLVKS